ncbi:MAG: hypothetical protein IIA45_01610 [Bacteroidetes bacterium]|nr:hypothetical protein [Bacteroidota bacterium]
MRFKHCLSTIILVLVIVCSGCDSNQTEEENLAPEIKEYKVIVHIIADPGTLNPYNKTSATSAKIDNQMFQQLINIDYKTLEIIPVLATARAEYQVINDTTVWFTYEIRPEAKWSNGEDVTAKDVEFSLKAIKNPQVDCHRIRPIFDFIEEVIFYDDNPKKLTLVSNTKYFLAEIASGDFLVIPKYIFDKKDLMDGFSIKQLNEGGDELAENEKIIEFANDFNSSEFGRDPAIISGSGAYEMVEWQTDERVKLRKKDNWWGDQLKGVNSWFEANPSELVYEVITDMTTAIVAMKGDKLDVMNGIPVKDFIELSENEKFLERFNVHSPMYLAYYYIGINMQDPKFTDKRVRKALAHLIDIDKVINTVMYGLADPTIGFVHPILKDIYNDTITPYSYSLDKSKQLLSEAGWADTNNDGILDKVINGNHTELIIDFLYNTGSVQKEQIGLIFQDEARKVKIKVNLISQESNNFRENTKKHNFDMFCSGIGASPVGGDPKQHWHTDSYNAGDNRVGFGNVESDALIDGLRSELDGKKRADLFKQLQYIIHDEVPFIFLYVSNERITISNKFTNAEPSIMNPGYWEPSFNLVEDHISE